MILLTGFEPFGGDTFNPSWPAVQQAAIALRGLGLQVRTVLLPVEFTASTDVLAGAIANAHGAAGADGLDLVLAVGQAGGTAGLALERVAINLDDARIPDNRGCAPVDEAIVAGGPAAYFSTLPVKACLQALAASGIAASASHSAGTFVCNHVFYAAMHHLTKLPGTRGGFIHVPHAPEQVAADKPSMEMADMARALEIIVRTALETAVDIKVSAGTTH